MQAKISYYIFYLKVSLFIEKLMPISFYNTKKEPLNSVYELLNTIKENHFSLKLILKTSLGNKTN